VQTPITTSIFRVSWILAVGVKGLRNALRMGAEVCDGSKSVLRERNTIPRRTAAVTRDSERASRRITYPRVAPLEPSGPGERESPSGLQGELR
jgi:hypothetical protein